MELLFNNKIFNKTLFEQGTLMCVLSVLLSVCMSANYTFLFTVPLFYLCFLCGYPFIVAYFIGQIVSTVFFLLPITHLIMSGITMLIMLIFMKARLSTKYMPYILTIISGIYFFYNFSFTIALSNTLLTYLNIQIFKTLPPLLVRATKELLTHTRIQALSVLILLSIISLLPFSRAVTFILIRVYILVIITYASLQDILSPLLYCSLYILFIDSIYKNDILACLLPLFFFTFIPCTKKYQVVSIYLISHLILPFFMPFDYFYHGFIIASSSLIFLAVPVSQSHKIVSQSYEELSLRQTLYNQVNNFTTLFYQMTNLFNETPSNNHSYEYVGSLYENICCHCSSCSLCFNHQDGPNRLVKLMHKGLNEGYDATDIDYIDHHCLQPEQLKISIADYRKDFQKIQQIQSVYTTMRKDLYQQFSLICDVFKHFSETLENGHIEESHIKEHLLGYNFPIEYLKKYYETQNVYYIEIGLYNITKKEIMEELLPILETYLNETLFIEKLYNPTHQLGYCYVLLKHETKYYIEYGLSQCSHDAIHCGDSYTMFEKYQKQYFALSDGMGQGKAAYEDSHLTLDVIKQLLLNGVHLEDTLNSINALLRIKNHSDMFTTLDFIEIDLTNAKCEVVKFGATVSYIIRDDQIIDIETSSLPIGIIAPLSLHSQKITLCPDDLVVISSDGFSDIKTLLQDHKMFIKDDHPQEIATYLIDRECANNPKDDITLIVLKLKKQR